MPPPPPMSNRVKSDTLAQDLELLPSQMMRFLSTEIRVKERGETTHFRNLQ